MQTSTFGLKFDSLRYDVPLKIRSRSSKHKKHFKLSQWYAQTITYWFIKYHAFTQEREWGEWYANTNIVADKIRTKICPTSSWVGGDQKSSLCLKTNQARCSSLKEWQKKGKQNWVLLPLSAIFDKMLEYIFPCCAQNYCVSSSHIHVYELLWFMSPFLVKCLVNGEILSTWWIYTHSFTVAASQIIGKYREL